MLVKCPHCQGLTHDKYSFCVLCGEERRHDDWYTVCYAMSTPDYVKKLIFPLDIISRSQDMGEL